MAKTRHRKPRHLRSRPDGATMRRMHAGIGPQDLIALACRLTPEQVAREMAPFHAAERAVREARASTAHIAALNTITHILREVRRLRYDISDADMDAIAVARDILKRRGMATGTWQSPTADHITLAAVRRAVALVEAAYSNLSRNELRQLARRIHNIYKSTGEQTCEPDLS